MIRLGDLPPEFLHVHDPRHEIQRQRTAGNSGACCGLGHDGGVDAAREKKLHRLNRRAGCLDGKIRAGFHRVRHQQAAEDELGSVVAEGDGDLLAAQRRYGRQARVARDDVEKSVGHHVDQPHAEPAIEEVGCNLRWHDHNLHRARGQAGAHLVGIAPSLEGQLLRNTLEVAC